MKLVLVSYLYNNAHCVEQMLKSIIPHVDGAYTMIDDKTNDKTEEICLDYGCTTRKFKFENFGKTRNMALSWVKNKSDWHISLDGDEALDFSSAFLLRDAIRLTEKMGYECIRPRYKVWNNIEMNGMPIEDEMHPARIVKSSSYPRVHTEKYIHETLVGHTGAVNLGEIIIHHFEPYWCSPFNGKNKYYWVIDKPKRYEATIKTHITEEGYNIWPDKEWEVENETL